MNRRLVFPVLFSLLATLVGVNDASAQSSSHSPLDTIDTSGHTRLKVFGAVYGSYLGITIPIAMEADDAAFYSLGLICGPSVGLVTASSYSRTHSLGSGDAIALSSLTWFGAMQGHLWGAVADVDEGSAEVGFGVVGSLVGFATGLSATGAHDFTDGQAASLGAGHWWGTALGYLAARANEDATSTDEVRGAAIGGATGLALGALGGRGSTHNDIRYLHIGGVLGWLYSTGIVVLQEPGRTGEAVTQIVGIGTGTTAGLLASKYRPWQSRPDLDLDHSGRMRAQVFSMAYGGYLATVIPLASGDDWWNEDTKRTYALAYMHAPPGLFLGTTFFTRNTNVPKAGVLAVSGLTWFGAMQGGLWASTNPDSKARDVAATSAAGSAAGLAAGVMVARSGLTEAQAAMIGAGNWWGSALGLLFGGAMLGEDADGESVAAVVALGGAAGVAVGPVIGRNMSLRQVRTMHVGGLAGWLFGVGALLGIQSTDARAAYAVMGTTTLTGLVMGAGRGDRTVARQKDYEPVARPFVTRRPGLNGETHTVVGFTLTY